MNKSIPSFGGHRTGQRFCQFDLDCTFPCDTTHRIMSVVNAVRPLITPEMQSLSAFDRGRFLTGK